MGTLKEKRSILATVEIKRSQREERRAKKQGGVVKGYFLNRKRQEAREN